MKTQEDLVTEEDHRAAGLTRNLPPPSDIKFVSGIEEEPGEYPIIGETLKLP